MKICTTPQEMQLFSQKCLQEGKKIAFVPTMGALHEGHISLVQKAQEYASCVVLSIFVNPTQFNDSQDFDSYPRTFDDDCRQAEVAGVDVIYAPWVQAMYPEGFSTTVSCGALTTRLEGAARPGHFDGVTTVVLKLFTAVNPTYALFGQKDAQQLLVIQKMVKELNLAVTIVACPTIREDDGLAKSSRNRLLTAHERSEASQIYAGISAAFELYTKGERSSQKLISRVEERYKKCTTFSVEYVALTNRECEEIGSIHEDGALLSVACRCKESGVRLIDNLSLGSLW